MDFWSGWVPGAIFVAFLAILWYLESRPAENEAENFRMAEEAATNRAKFAEEEHTAFVLGHTGETGKALVKELLSAKLFSKVVLIGRREVKYEDPLYKDVEQRVVDFDKLDEYKSSFEGLDTGFCCLGTTRGKAGKEGFVKVDHDYVVNSAKIAKEAGCKHFHLMTSAGSNANSSFLYTRVKGEVEEELKEMNFDRLSIYRPGVLLCNREESRPFEAVFRGLIKTVNYAFPTVGGIKTSSLAKAMVNVAVSPTDEKIRLFDNKQLHQISGDLKK